MTAAKGAAEGSTFDAAQAAVRSNLVTRGLEGDQLDDLHQALTRTVINALSLAGQQAKRIIAGLTVSDGATH